MRHVYVLSYCIIFFNDNKYCRNEFRCSQTHCRQMLMLLDGVSYFVVACLLQRRHVVLKQTDVERSPQQNLWTFHLNNALKCEEGDCRWNFVLPLSFHCANTRVFMIDIVPCCAYLLILMRELCLKFTKPLQPSKRRCCLHQYQLALLGR